MQSIGYGEGLHPRVTRAVSPAPLTPKRGEVYKKYARHE
jgi:hypothetical protein